MDLKILKGEFLKKYDGDQSDIQVFFAPGRVNLIGEHTDYNGGYVLPFSLQYGTYLLVRLNPNPKVKFRSLNFDQRADVCMKNSIAPIGNEWINYPLGVIKEFQDRGISIPGMELLFAGNIPNGAGLSSSASIEMVMAIALKDMLMLDWNTLELIKISQSAENNFVGMKCGIMDQFAVGIGKKDYAVFLDCGTLDYSLIPFDLKNYKLIITNTNKRRELAGSKYNERRSECEMAVEDISQVKKIENLSQVKPNELESYKGHFRNNIVKNRAEHIILENERVLQSVEMLKSGNLSGFGKLMFESHISLRDLYEVSCKELDVLVEEASKIEGVVGARMTGAGFGGCTITLLEEDQIEVFQKEIEKVYTDRTGIVPDFYLAESGNGVTKIE